MEIRNGRKRPLAATRWERPLAATCWERPLAAACGHSLGAATRLERPLSGHLRPLAWSGHLQPLAATRVAASGCVLVEIHGRVGILKKAVLLERRFFSSLEVGWSDFIVPHETMWLTKCHPCLP